MFVISNTFKSTYCNVKSICDKNGWTNIMGNKQVFGYRTIKTYIQSESAITYMYIHMAL